MVILVGGTACIGKSSLATQLAERLNLSTVLKTGIINELVHNILRFPLIPSSCLSVLCSQKKIFFGFRDNPGQAVDEPVKASFFESKEALLEKFSEECCLVKKGLDAEFHKCFKEGKSIIVEGIHVNPQIYSEMVLESRKHISESILEGKIPSRGCLRLLFCV